MNVKKYFWWLNPEALRKTKSILRDPENPLFIQRVFEFLSRNDEPDALFSIISKEQFIQSWPEIRRYWSKRSTAQDFKAWWETVYEELLGKVRPSKKLSGTPEKNLQAFAQSIRNARMEKGWTQSDFARRVRMKQPDISAIEQGKENITLATLIRLCKVLEIKAINF